MRITAATAVAILAGTVAAVPTAAGAIHSASITAGGYGEDCAAKCRGLALQAKGNCLANCGGNGLDDDATTMDKNVAGARRDGDDHRPGQRVRDCTAKYCDGLTFEQEWNCIAACSALDGGH